MGGGRAVRKTHNKYMFVIVLQHDLTVDIFA